MKRKIMIVLVALNMVPLFPGFAEEAAPHDGTVTLCPDGRTVNGPFALCGGSRIVQPRESKFYEYLSACMAGRAGFDPFGSISSANSPTRGATGTSPSTDQAAFQAACLSCHASGNAPSLAGISGAKAVEAIRRLGLPASDPQHMPKGTSISDSDKSAIINFLQSRM